MSADDIMSAAALLFPAGSVVEVRCIRSTGVISKWFTDPALMAEYCEKMSNDEIVKGVYWTIQRLKGEMGARVTQPSNGSTSDGDIDSFRFIPLDIDPERAANTNSTDDEKCYAFAMAASVESYLRERGWPDPIKADSGNGSHSLYRVDIPNDVDGINKDIIRSALTALSERFSDEKANVDVTVYNPSRILKAYPTMVRKGPASAERPHRTSGIIAIPKEIKAVSLDMVKALAAECHGLKQTRGKKTEYATPNTARASTANEWMKKFIEKHSPVLELKAVKDKPDATVYEFKKCPFNDKHGDRGEACVIVHSNGDKTFKCHHSHCSEYGWSDFEALFDEKKAKAKKNEHDESAVRQAAEDVGLNEFYCDKDIALALYEKYGEVLIPDIGSQSMWFAYDNRAHVWCRRNSDIAKQYASAVVEQKIRLAETLPNTDENIVKGKILSALHRYYENRGLEEVCGRYRTLPQITHRDIGFFDGPDTVDLLNLLNGTFDLDGYKLLSHNHQHHITKIAPVIYDPATTCPNWTAMIDDIFSGDKELVKYFQKLCGYCLTGRNSVKHWWQWLGTKMDNGMDANNGKSSIVNIILALLGFDETGYAQAVSHSLLKECASDAGDRPQPQLVNLRAKRIVVLGELPKTAKDMDTMFKTITGNDSISARGMRSDRVISFFPTFKIMVPSNHAYRMDASDSSMTSRIVYIMFRKAFLSPDMVKSGMNKGSYSIVTAELKQRLKKAEKELPGILNWMIEGKKLFDKEGLQMNTAMTTVHDETIWAGNTLYEYLDEYATVIDTGREFTKTVFDDYMKRCVANGRKGYATQARMVSVLRDIARDIPRYKGLVIDRTISKGNDKQKGIKGLALISNVDPMSMASERLRATKEVLRNAPGGLTVADIAGLLEVDDEMVEQDIDVWAAVGDVMKVPGGKVVYVDR
jgi:P4 family phage/plasmid primase-like protien